MKSDWNRFFQDEAPRYLDNRFTRNTSAEVDFIIRELGLNAGDEILDMGCGTGRHSIELARRGFHPTGIDLSADMLGVARALAEKENLPIEFIQGDATATKLDRHFNHVICLCEGAFSLLEIDGDSRAHHQAILANIHAMMRPCGRFLLTALNGFRYIRQHSDEDVRTGLFDQMTLSHVDELTLNDGSTIRVRQKGFLPEELTMLLSVAGFHVLGWWGGTAGEWNKEPLKLDEIEVMFLAERR